MHVGSRPVTSLHRWKDRVTVGTQPSRDRLGSRVYRELEPKPRGLCLGHNLVCAGVTGVEIDMFVHTELWVVTRHHHLLKISHSGMVKMQISGPTPTEHDSLRSEVQELHFKQMSR